MQINRLAFVPFLFIFYFFFVFGKCKKERDQFTTQFNMSRLMMSFLLLKDFSSILGEWGKNQPPFSAKEIRIIDLIGFTMNYSQRWYENNEFVHVCDCVFKGSNLRFSFLCFRNLVFLVSFFVEAIKKKMIFYAYNPCIWKTQKRMRKNFIFFTSK